MAGFKKSPYNSLYVNPLNDLKHIRSCSEGDKENAAPKAKENGNAPPPTKQFPYTKCSSTTTRVPLKSSSLQLCMQLNEPDSTLGSKMWCPISSEPFTSSHVWDYSDSEAAPASSWSTLPNRSLLCRPLPLDIGRCTCVIVKEALPQGLDGGALYSLYTNLERVVRCREIVSMASYMARKEGQGRQDRKLAIAHHKRRNGKSEFIVAQSVKGILCNSDDSFIGIVTANLLGSKYHIWDQGTCLNSVAKRSKPLLAVIHAYNSHLDRKLQKHTGMDTKAPVYAAEELNSGDLNPDAKYLRLSPIKNIYNILMDCPTTGRGKKDKVHQLFSRVPHYNSVSKQYELDFRERGRAGLRIQSSVKNFQLTLEEKGKQTILQLGRVGKSKYVMDYR
ncbi:Tubby-like protein 8 [Vitis vinifera]|uniref:Tubby-like protein 8 n=1 Tax=Vitis vinifera TaxID=29760 RepID=A0A438ENL4_VITVI|nr:Tubby-like protein 8 [Vitis vinifera]